jgi:AbrB family looped-hinge helix DNA binding protein
MNAQSLREWVGQSTERARDTVDTWRERSRLVDLAFGVFARERIIATSILSAFVAFRMFVLLVPFVYVLVAGVGLYGEADPSGPETIADNIGFGGLAARNIAEAVQASERTQWVALAAGSAALLWASVGVSKSVYAVHLVAWRLPRARMRTGLVAVLGPVLLILGFATTSAVAAAVRERNAGIGLGVTLAAVAVYAALWLLASIALPREPGAPWTALVPGAVLVAVGLQLLHVAVVYYFADKASRASSVYGSLGVAVVVLTWLFLIGRLSVGAAEVNAGLWEQRQLRRAQRGVNVRIDPDGRVALPAALRDELGLHPGDHLLVDREGDGVRLSPAGRPEAVGAGGGGPPPTDR